MLVGQSSGYDPLMRPTLATTPRGEAAAADRVGVQIRIDAIQRSTSLKFMELRGEMEVWWSDPRLAFNGTADGGCFDAMVQPVPVSLSGQAPLWLPDVRLTSRVQQIVRTEAHGRHAAEQPYDFLVIGEARRKVNYYLTTTIIPIVALLLVSFSGFFIDRKSAPARRRGRHPRALERVSLKRKSSVLETLKDARLEEVEEDFANGNEKTMADRILKHLFNTLDHSKDGQLDPGEIQYAMRYFGHYVSRAQTMELIARVDKDGDRQLDYEEYQRLMFMIVTDWERPAPRGLQVQHAESPAELTHHLAASHPPLYGVPFLPLHAATTLRPQSPSVRAGDFGGGGRFSPRQGFAVSRR
ncbi:extracellular ligand-gated ion channel [Aureococcus anophagefferens]|nr:extracellular ligand-gated ion channel [Aureococcus anophagefferens]